MTIPRYKLVCPSGLTSGPNGVKLIDLETGKELHDIHSIEIERMLPNELVRIKVELIGVELDVTVLSDQCMTYVKGREAVTDDSGI